MPVTVDMTESHEPWYSGLELVLERSNASSPTAHSSVTSINTMMKVRDTRSWTVGDINRCPGLWESKP